MEKEEHYQFVDAKYTPLLGYCGYHLYIVDMY